MSRGGTPPPLPRQGVTGSGEARAVFFHKQHIVCPGDTIQEITREGKSCLAAPTSSLSVLMSFWAAAAAAAGTGTPGLPATSMGAVGRISAGTSPGDTGPR